MTAQDVAFVDAFFAAPRAAQVLRSAPREIELRALPLEGAAQGDFGPPPVEPVRLRLRERERSARLNETPAEIQAVRTRTRSLAWSFERWCATAVVELEIDGERRELLVAQAIAPDEATAEAELASLVTSLRSYVGATDADTPPTRDSADEARAEPDASHGEAPSPRAADRYSLRLEGDALVLRDHRSRGPRERANRYRLLALACVVLGAAGAAVFAERWAAGAPTTSLLGFGIVPLVLIIAAFAMNEIARHADRYRATSAPLAWFADDRVVVAPWVARDGSIDTRPEGRLGAAITCGEILAVQVHERDAVFAVTLEGLHGPMEVLLATSARDGQHYARMIEDVVARVRSPRKKVTALMRAAAAREQQRSG